MVKIEREEREKRRGGNREDGKRNRKKETEKETEACEEEYTEVAKARYSWLVQNRKLAWRNTR